MARQLSDQELFDLTQRYFGDLGPQVVTMMYAIAKRESGGNAAAININPGTRDDSRGLWQINIRPDANPQYASWDLSDPEQNAKAARQLYDAAGFSPWSTYPYAQGDVASRALDQLQASIQPGYPGTKPEPDSLIPVFQPTTWQSPIDVMGITPNAHPSTPQSLFAGSTPRGGPLWQAMNAQRPMPLSSSAPFLDPSQWNSLLP